LSKKEDIKELEAKVKELENLAQDKTLDVAEDLKNAKSKLKNAKKESQKTLTAWDRVNIVRSPKRPTALDYIDLIFDDFVELHGDRECTDDKSIVCGLANIGSQNFTIIAEQKGRNTKENIERNFGMPNPESYKKGIRFMKQAEKFKRPVITFIDTKGAYPGLNAEEKGQRRSYCKKYANTRKFKNNSNCNSNR
jgi:acetyl-CoA carboxylase carboxyl transferase subunit alpha